MSQSNGVHRDQSLVEKQALASAIKKMVGGIEDRFGKALGEALLFGQQESTKVRDELLKRLDQARLDAAIPFQKNFVDTEPIAKELARQAEDRSAERAVLKDLIDAALTQPIPMVQAPEHSIEVNPTPVTFDLSELANVIKSNTDMLSGILDEIMEQRQERVALTRALSEIASINGALLAALTRPRAQEPVTVKFNDDGTEFTIQR